MKERFLIHCLSRAGDVPMALFKRIGRQAPRPQQLLKRRREQIVKFRRSVSPLGSDVLAMMTEECQIKLKCAVRNKAHNSSNGIQQRGTAATRKAHDLILDAVV